MTRFETMLFRTRILQDVAEYAIRTADHVASAGEPARGPAVAEPPAIELRGERASAHLTSASAIALGPWAVFALSFLILSAYREEIEQALDFRLGSAIDLDGLGDLSRLLAGEPDAIPMFGQAQATGQFGVASTNIGTADAPSYAPEPNLGAALRTGPFSVAMLPDELFNFDLNAARGGLNGLASLDDKYESTIDDFSTKRLKEFEQINNPVDGGEDGGENGDEEDAGGGPGQVLEGNFDNNTIAGTNGDDVIFGLAGDDVIAGKGGNDAILPGTGYNSVDGGPGFDSVAFSGKASEYSLTRNFDGTLRLEHGATGEQTQILDVEMLVFGDGSIELSRLPGGFGLLEVHGLLNTSYTLSHLMADYGVSDIDPDNGSHGQIIKGDSGDDILVGTDHDDVIFGGPGNDLLDGRDGDDLLVAGPGADVLYGGAGTDIAAYQGHSTDFELKVDDKGIYVLTNLATDDVTILDGVEIIYFGDGFVDLRDIGAGAQTIPLADWLDTSMTSGDLMDIYGGGEPDDGGDGDSQILLPTPTIDGEWIQGGDRHDELNGTEFGDLIVGLEGDDLMAGRDGNDIFLAEPGSDTIEGGLGLDMAAFMGTSHDYTLYRMSDGSFSLVSERTDAETVIRDVEFIFFADGFLAVSRVKQDGVVPLSSLVDPSKTSTTLLAQLGIEMPGGGETPTDPTGTGTNTVGYAIYGDDRDNRLFGTERDDSLLGGAGNDEMYGRGGADLFVVGPGYNLVDGGEGRDAASFRGTSRDYSLYAMSDGSFSVIDDRTAEEATLRDVEGLFFADGFVDLSGLGKDPGRIDIATFLDTSVTSRDILENAGGDASVGAPLSTGYLFLGDGGDNDIIGTENDDFVIAGPGSDRVAAQGGDDIILANPGNDLIDGGEGFDIAAIDGASVHYRLFDNGDRTFTVVDGKHGDVTELVNVESLYFNDGTVDLTRLAGKGGEIHIGDILDTDATVEDLIDLSLAYPEFNPKDPPPEDSKIVVFEPPPLVLAPIETLSNPDTGETV